MADVTLDLTVEEAVLVRGAFLDDVARAAVGELADAVAGGGYQSPSIERVRRAWERADEVIAAAAAMVDQRRSLTLSDDVWSQIVGDGLDHRLDRVADAGTDAGSDEIRERLADVERWLSVRDKLAAATPSTPSDGGS